MNEQNKPVGPHNLILEERKRLSISGVTEIDSFDEQTVVLFCTEGQIAIRGEGLHINRIDVDSGELTLEGNRIDSFAYADNRAVHGGLLGRLFR